MRREPANLDVCLWCHYYCVDANPLGRPRNFVYDPAKCNCLRAGCEHGQNLVHMVRA